MTHIEAQQLLETNVIRGAMMSGFGCVTYFVPVKQVQNFTEVVKQNIPAGIELEIVPLLTPCKKGTFEYWQPKDGASIPELILKAGGEKF